MTCMPPRLTIAHIHSFLSYHAVLYNITNRKFLLQYYLVSSPETVSSIIEILLQEWWVQMLLIPP
jgi:hypothetical protein